MTGEFNYADSEYDDEENQQDRRLTQVFLRARHIETIEGTKIITQSWRMKERMKTVSVALVLCLNVGVDPPDIVKTSPCATLECWIDPFSCSPQKALEAIGANLQKQYERWQPRARYKQSLDPTVDEVKKLCTSLRRNAKEERVLFHYNGHGVPKPTVNGEIWVFNKSYTQYIPLSLYDLQTWVGSPSIYVYDCSNAGIIIDSFKQFSVQRQTENSLNGLKTVLSYCTKYCIQLAACGTHEILPMYPELPADLFTSCLTTPIKIALRWYVLQNTDRLIPGLTQELVDKIPGQLNDRRTMLGELNWIFTAITDTIAWNTLPRDLFQSLFRQDLLVASLFRNFLLAERIMRSCNCTPVSSPKLPATYQHPMWQAWDLALDQCLSQLPAMLHNDDVSFQHSPFFAEQLTAFQVWLAYGSVDRNPPEQLPIVLQVLLSQVHRLRALDLLGKFLNLGPWAVSLALSVGIFPYVLKLLQSSARDLRHLLVFIWAKILSVDRSCQADLVKDGGHKYFISVLADNYMPAEHRTTAVFVLAMIVDDYLPGKEACLQGNMISICLDQLAVDHPHLRQWLCLCLGKIWMNYDAARWCGVRDSAHEKLYDLLQDSVPEVRAAAVFALGTFVNNNCERHSDHASNIDQGVGMKLVTVVSDGSPLVRKELAVAFAGIVQQFELQFSTIAFKLMEEERLVENVAMVTATAPETAVPLNPIITNIRRSSSRASLKSLFPNPISISQLPAALNSNPVLTLNTSLEGSGELGGMKRVASSSSISGSALNNVYMGVWRSLILLSMDPYPHVSDLARELVNSVKLKAAVNSRPRYSLHDISQSHSAPSSPSNRLLHSSDYERSPPKGEISPDSGRGTASPTHAAANVSLYSTHSTQFSQQRKMFIDAPDPQTVKRDSESGERMLNTELFQWCCKHLCQPARPVGVEDDPESEEYHARQTRFIRNTGLRVEGKDEQLRAGFNRLDDQVFVNKNQGVPTVLKFHPYEPHLAVADKEGVTIWEWEQGTKMSYLFNDNPRMTRITSMNFINAHDSSLLLCGSDDGAVRVWRNYTTNEGQDAHLVSAFYALSDMLPTARGSGMVSRWDQESSLLYVSGDVRIVRVWDPEHEMYIQDMPTGAESCVTSLAIDPSSRSLMLAGCGDGSVRVFDRRLTYQDCRVKTLREHSGWIVNVCFQSGLHSNIISASVSGDVRFWDRSYTESIKSLSLQQGLTSMEAHPYADVLACGSLNQFVSVFNQSGDPLSMIKHHEGFMGQRIGPVSCLAFHPHKVKLAAGSTDSFVSVYSSPDNRRR